MNLRIFALPLMLLAPGIALFGDSFESLHEDFLEQHRALVEERMEIREAYPDANSPARDQAMEEWRDQNWERIETVRGMATEIGRLSAERESGPEGIERRIATLREMDVPENLSPAQKAFLTKRRQLMLDKLEFERGIANLPMPARRQALNRWREEAADQFAELHDLSRNAAEEQEAAMTWEPIEPPAIPDSVTDEMRTFMEARHALMADLNEIRRTHSDPESRQAAVENWREENRERIDEMHRLAPAPGN